MPKLKRFKNKEEVMRKGTILALAGTAMSVAASVPAYAADKLTVCYVTFSLQVDYFQAGVGGAKKAADELGVNLIVHDPQADTGRQVSQFEDCIAQKADAIIIDPIESTAVAGPIEEAGKKGIPIAALDTPINSPYVVVQLGIPQFDASREFGHFIAGYIIGKMGGKAKVGVMLASTEVQLARRDGFLEALKAVPGATVVATGDGRNIIEKAQSAAEDMLTTHPDIDVIYATGDPQLQGGLAAAASQGRTIAFFGWDDIPQPFIKPLEEGRIVGFLKQAPQVGGEMAVRFLVKKLKGETIPAHYSYNPTVVTQYNLDKYR
jgi:ABC-type sugar transport system substrate-binding protein